MHSSLAAHELSLVVRILTILLMAGMLYYYLGARGVRTPPPIWAVACLAVLTIALFYYIVRFLADPIRDGCLFQTLDQRCTHERPFN